MNATPQPPSVDVKEVARELSWYSATTYGLRAIGMVRTLALTALIPLEVYGQMQMIVALGPYLLIPTFVGSATAISQSTAQGKEYLYHHFQKLRDRLALIPALLSLGIAAFYLWHEAQPGLALTIAVVGLLYPLTLQDMFQNVLLGRRDYRTLMRVQWPAEILATLVTLAAAYVAPDNLLWLVVPAVVVRGLSWVVCRWRVPVDRRAATVEETDREWAYIKQRSALGLLGFGASQLDRVLVGAFLGFESLALYSFAKTASEQLNVLQRSALGVLFQRLAARGEAEAHRLLPRFMLMLVAVTAVAALGVDLLFSVYVQRVVPEKFGESLPYLHWLLFAICISGPGGVVATYFSAQRKTRWEWVHTTLIPLFYVGTMLVTLPVLGVDGVVYAFVARGAFVSLLLWALYRWYVRRSGSVLD